jgi:hypothetical protein
VMPRGIIDTIAGGGTESDAEHRPLASEAQLTEPDGVAITLGGQIYVRRCAKINLSTLSRGDLVRG